MAYETSERLMKDLYLMVVFKLRLISNLSSRKQDEILTTDDLLYQLKNKSKWDKKTNREGKQSKVKQKTLEVNE